MPETSTILLDFGEQGSFEYKVKNFVYQEHEVRELNQKKMVVLIPFQLLKLRNLIKEKSEESTWKALQELILNDIIGSIKANLEVGNIIEEDAVELKELTLELYYYLCDHYEELGGQSDMKELLEGAMVLPLDKYRIRIDELEKENEEIKEKAEAKTKEAEAKTKEAQARIKELEELLANTKK